MDECLPLDGEELAAVVKSLSISYDSLIAKIRRLKPGRHHDEAVVEFRVVDRVLSRAREQQAQRVS